MIKLNKEGRAEVEKIVRRAEQNDLEEALREIVSQKQELLRLARDLYDHAEWMGCPRGYEPKDFPIFKEAPEILKKYPE